MAKPFSSNQWDKWVQNPPAGPRALVIAPEAALMILTYAEDRGVPKMQRPISDWWVRELARRMLKDWSDEVQVIWIDEKGRVQDGQHRLHAAIESGHTIIAWVHFGAPENAYHYHDIGRKRSHGDIFATHGEPNSAAAAAVTRQVIRMRNDEGEARTPEEVFNYYCRLGTPLVQDAARLAYRLVTNKVPKPSAIAGVYVLAKGIDDDLAESFFNAIVNGANVGPRSIERKLRDHMLLNGRGLSSEQVRNDVIRAWNARRAKRRTFSTNYVRGHVEMV